MKQILVMMVAVVLLGCSKDTPETSQAAEAEPQVASKPTPVSPADEKLIADPIVEVAVRRELKKPEGKLTEADLESVRSLDLSDTKITDAGLKELAKLQELRKLFLSNTKITDEGLKEMAKLQKLKFLHLIETKITDADVTKLKKALPNCNIFGP